MSALFGDAEEYGPFREACEAVRGPAAGKDNVVDAEFEEVTEKDKNRRAS